MCFLALSLAAKVQYCGRIIKLAIGFVDWQDMCIINQKENPLLTAVPVWT